MENKQQGSSQGSRTDSDTSSTGRVAEDIDTDAKRQDSSNYFQDGKH